MYEAYFRLQGRPFLAAPDTRRYFPGAAIEQARQTLMRCIDRGEGVGAIIGSPGTGKSLLCQLLAEHYEGRFDVALLRGRLHSRQALLQAILYELELPYRGLDEGELRLALLDHLEPRSEPSEGLLLVVDEAHTLPWRLLEEVRLITNLVRSGLPRVRVVLAGGPLLEERFASPKMSSFSQRLAARCYLEPLDAPQTAGYVRSQISAVGGDAAAVFDDSALRSVYRATDGIPRLINQLCDHALILVSLGGGGRVTSEAIDEAWADLQQLPAPWIADNQTSEGGSIVEFGRLDDAHEERPPAIPFLQALARPAEIDDFDDSDEIDRKLGDRHPHVAEFQPLNDQATEIELDFPEFGDPFSEHFAEEEVVLERFRSDAELFAQAPRVTSPEGHQLSDLLASWPRPAALPLAAVAPQATLAIEPAPTSASAIVPPTPIRVAEIKPLAATAGQGILAATSGPPSAGPAVVVVDETPKPTLAARAKTPERKPEFKSLFSKLRRG